LRALHSEERFLYLVIGIFIGRHLKSSRKQSFISLSSDPDGAWGTQLQAAEDELGRQLGYLIKVQHDLRLAPDTTKSLESLRLLLDQIVKCVKQSQHAVRQVGPRSDSAAHTNQEAVTDAAGLAGEKWFPGLIEPADFQGHEQRAAQRFPFHHVQPVAPAEDGTLPDESAFLGAQFRDISTTGFSFFVPEEFPADKLVAKLGTEPDIVTVLAEVVRQHEVWHAGSWVFQVGCRILKRLDPRTSPGDGDQSGWSEHRLRKEPPRAEGQSILDGTQLWPCK
jgi:hypothetical protein